MRTKLMKVVAYAIATLGILASSSSFVGCIGFFYDEPELPASMIK